MVDGINEQLIICRCSLGVACSAGSGYSCHIGLETIESYLILRAVVLAYIYGICFTTQPRVVVVAPRWASGLPMLWPSWGAVLGGGAFLVWSGLPPWYFGPQCPVLLHLEQWESHAGQFVLLAGCCHVQLGQSFEGADGVWPLPLWLVLAAQCFSWWIASTGLEQWETCSQACWMVKWFTAMSASSLEGVLNGFAISFPRNFPSWWYAQTIWQYSSCSWCSLLIILQQSISVLMHAMRSWGPLPALP